jgi:hypothetical protein
MLRLGRVPAAQLASVCLRGLPSCAANGLQFFSLLLFDLAHRPLVALPRRCALPSRTRRRHCVACLRRPRRHWGVCLRRLLRHCSACLRRIRWLFLPRCRSGSASTTPCLDFPLSRFLCYFLVPYLPLSLSQLNFHNSEPGCGCTWNSYISGQCGFEITSTVVYLQGTPQNAICHRKRQHVVSFVKKKTACSHYPY